MKIKVISISLIALLFLTICDFKTNAETMDIYRENDLKNAGFSSESIDEFKQVYNEISQKSKKTVFYTYDFYQNTIKNSSTEKCIIKIVYIF